MMKKTLSGKLNMALSMRIALGLALVIALTGCSRAATATSGNSGSTSSSSIASNASSTTADSTATSAPSSAPVVEAPDDVEPGELAEANQPTPSSIVVGTPSTVNPDDFWVSDDEYDLIGYFTACGAEARFYEHALDAGTVEAVFSNGWSVQVKSGGSIYSGQISIAGPYINGSTTSYGRSVPINDGGPMVNLSSTKYSVGEKVLQETFRIMPITESVYSGGNPFS